MQVVPSHIYIRGVENQNYRVKKSKAIAIGKINQISKWEPSLEFGNLSNTCSVER